MRLFSILRSYVQVSWTTGNSYSCPVCPAFRWNRSEDGFHQVGKRLSRTAFVRVVLEGQDAEQAGAGALSLINTFVALAIDPNLPVAHATRGWWMALNEWNWVEAERLFRHALSLDAAAPFAPERSLAEALDLGRGPPSAFIAVYAASYVAGFVALFAQLGDEYERRYTPEVNYEQLVAIDGRARGEPPAAGMRRDLVAATD